MQQIKSYFNVIVISILVFVIFLQKSCAEPTPLNPEPTVVVKVDTVWKHIYHTKIKKVPVKSYVYYEPDPPQFLPGEHIDTCKARFNVLLKKHNLQTVYQDTLKLDSLGTVTIIDTVWLNKLGKRTYIQDIKIPVITKKTTITKERSAVRQLYIGGNLFTSNLRTNMIIPGLIYKDRKDRIYQVNVGIDNTGSIYYGGGLFWKIKFR